MSVGLGIAVLVVVWAHSLRLLSFEDAVVALLALMALILVFRIGGERR